MYAIIIYYPTSHVIIALQNNGALQTHISSRICILESNHICTIITLYRAG